MANHARDPEEIVRAFNIRFSIGDPFLYRSHPTAEPLEVVTTTNAYVQVDHTAVVMVDKVDQYVALDALEPVKAPPGTEPKRHPWRHTLHPITGEMSIPALVTVCRRAIAEAHQYSGGVAVIVPREVYVDLVDRYALDWPASVFHDYNVRETCRELCAKIAADAGADEVAAKIRASKPYYPPIG